MSAPRQGVVLVTRSMPRGVDDDTWDMVVGVRVGDQFLDLPEESLVIVEHEAGGARNTVTLTLIAHTVRYEPELAPDPDPGTAPVCSWPNTGMVPSPEHCYSGPRCAHTWGGLMAESPEDQTVTYCLPVCVVHERVAREAGWAIRPPGGSVAP